MIKGDHQRKQFNVIRNVEMVCVDYKDLLPVSSPTTSWQQFISQRRDRRRGRGDGGNLKGGGGKEEDEQRERWLVTQRERTDSIKERMEGCERREET